MAITWQSVAAPSFFDSNQLNIQAGNQVTRGLESLGKTAQNIKQQGVTNRQAELQNQLLNLASDSGVGEKEFLGRAIALGKENGLTPQQSLSQIDAIKNVRDQAAALTTDQQLEFDTRKANLEQAAQLSQDTIARALTQFDQQNPQVQLEQSKVDAFAAGGGLGKVFDSVYGGIEDSGDREKTIAAVTDLQLGGNYDDYVLGQTIEQMGVGEEGVIFDSALINSALFKRLLKRNQERFNSFKQNATKRLNLEQTLAQNHSSAIRKQREDLLKFQRDARQANLDGFSF